MDLFRMSQSIHFDSRIKEYARCFQAFLQVPTSYGGRKRCLLILLQPITTKLVLVHVSAACTFVCYFLLAVDDFVPI